MIDAPVHRETAADSTAHVRIKNWIHSLPRTANRLAERGQIAVVLHENRQPGLLAQPIAQRKIRPARDVVRFPDAPGAPIHRSAVAHPDCRRLPLRHQLGHGLRNLLANAFRTPRPVDGEAVAIHDAPIGRPRHQAAAWYRRFRWRENAKTSPWGVQGRDWMEGAHYTRAAMVGASADALRLRGPNSLALDGGDVLFVRGNLYAKCDTIASHPAPPATSRQTPWHSRPRAGGLAAPPRAGVAVPSHFRLPARSHLLRQGRPWPAHGRQPAHLRALWAERRSRPDRAHRLRSQPGQHGPGLHRRRRSFARGPGRGHRASRIVVRPPGPARLGARHQAATERYARAASSASWACCVHPTPASASFPPSMCSPKPSCACVTTSEDA